jgi:hypothetical protein
MEQYKERHLLINGVAISRKLWTSHKSWIQLIAEKCAMLRFSVIKYPFVPSTSHHWCFVNAPGHTSDLPKLVFLAKFKAHTAQTSWSEVPPTQISM